MSYFVLNDCKGSTFFLYVNVLFVIFYVQKRKIILFRT